MKSNREAYRNFCRQVPDLPLFLQDWYLDAVCCEGTWDAALVADGDRVRAAMPYYLVRGRLGHRYITMPPLTQVMGPWILSPQEQKPWSRLAYEKKIMGQLIDRLPPFDSFSQSFHYSLTNWLPFYWRGYRQSSGYTYVLEDLSDLDRVYAGFRGNIRREIQKARKQVRIYCEDNIEKFYPLACLTYRRQGLSFPFSLDFLKNLDAACARHQARQIFFAEDGQGRIHAGLYMTQDLVSAFHLMSGADPGLRSSGATSLLMWEAICRAARSQQKFDFEGSMIEAVEPFFRAFGAVPRSYFFISKVNSRLLRLKQFIKEMG